MVLPGDGDRARDGGWSRSRRLPAAAPSLSAAAVMDDGAAAYRPWTTVIADRPPSTDAPDDSPALLCCPWVGLLPCEMGENMRVMSPCPVLPKRLVVCIELWDMSDRVGDMVDARESGRVRSPGTLMSSSSSAIKCSFPGRGNADKDDGAADGDDALAADGRFLGDEERGAEKALLVDRDEDRNRGNTTDAGGRCAAVIKAGDVEGRCSWVVGDGLMCLAPPATDDGDTIMFGSAGGPDGNANPTIVFDE